MYPKRGKTSKKLRKLRLKHRLEQITKFADDLNRNTPASEVWFRERFNKEPIERIYGKHKDNDFIDRYNTPLGHSFIPDIMNHGYAFIIEVDGSIHNTLKQAYKDLAKDTHYKRQGYKVFRVVAYDEKSYAQFLVDFKAYLETEHKSRLIALYNELKGIVPESEYSQRQSRVVKYNRYDTHIVMHTPSSVGPKVILRKQNV